MMEDTEKAKQVIITILEDFNRSSTNISSDASRVAIAIAILDQLNNAPVVQ